MASAVRNAGVLALFDVDGTLTALRKVPPPQFSSFPDLFSLFSPLSPPTARGAQFFSFLPNNRVLLRDGM
jgi:hypothetical protein